MPAEIPSSLPARGPLPVRHPAARPEFHPLPGLGAGDAVERGHGRGEERFAAIYLHVPFCSVKCHYCDFYSLAGRLDLADAYLAALDTELALLTGHFGRPRPETLFIGGGTPTLLPPRQLELLLRILLSHVDPTQIAEFTVESNPNTFSPEHARVLAGHGVNRLSFGAQSFIPAELKTLQRDHDPDSAARAFETARRAGIANLNLDLIFGIPGQTLDSWDHSLSRALALAPTHLSAYSLIYEPATPMTARLRQGLITPIDEELELQLFQHTYTRLRGAGFHRYETSNYARSAGGAAGGVEGANECRHNLHYWLGDNFLSAGPSAASAYENHRWKNVQNMAHYLAALGAGIGDRGSGIGTWESESWGRKSEIVNRKSKIENPLPRLPISFLESLPPFRRAGELATLHLRLTRGLVYADFIVRTGLDPRPFLAPIVRKYAGLGVLESLPDQAGLRLTDAGTPVSNTILADVLAAFPER